MVLCVFSSEMNCCLKSGIHEHSPNSQIHILITWLFSIDFPDHGEDGFHVVRCVRRYLEVVVPCRFRILFDFPGQLKNWLCVQGGSPKLYCFGQQVPLCSTRFPPQDCLSLLNILLLPATGLSAAFPSTRQGMHP